MYSGGFWDVAVLPHWKSLQPVGSCMQEGCTSEVLLMHTVEERPGLFHACFLAARQ